MVAPISLSTSISLQLTVLGLFISLLFLPILFIFCCLPCCGITACICHTRKKKRQTWLDKKVFQAASRLFWFLKKKKNQDDTSYFVILDKRAPVSYPYYLLIMTTLITFYTVYTILVNSLYIRYPRVSNFNSINGTNYDYYDYGDSSICKRTDYCMEIDFVDGLEAAATVFSICVITFAIITYSMLKCTSYIGNDHPCNWCKCCSYFFVILLQIVGFITPRIVYYIFLFSTIGGGSSGLLSQKVGGYTRDDDSPPPGYFHYNSQVALLAILDSISMSMLTPWYLFVKNEAKKKEDDSKEHNLDSIPNV